MLLANTRRNDDDHDGVDDDDFVQVVVLKMYCNAVYMCKFTISVFINY